MEEAHPRALNIKEVSYTKYQGDIKEIHTHKISKNK